VTVTTNRVGRTPLAHAGKVAAKPPLLVTAKLIAAQERITVGSVLLNRGTMLPPAFAVDLMRVGEWDLVSGHNALALDRKLRGAGWHFFFIVPTVEASAFGLDAEKTFTRALREITRAVQARGFNAVEVAALNRQRWMGVHHVSITARPRHVRDSPFVRDLDRNRHGPRQWDFKGIFAVRKRQGS